MSQGDDGVKTQRTVALGVVHFSGWRNAYCWMPIDCWVGLERSVVDLACFFPFQADRVAICGLGFPVVFWDSDPWAGRIWHWINPRLGLLEEAR